MNNHEDAVIVVIHFVCRDCDPHYAVMVGKNPLGPLGGRAGNVMDGTCLADNLTYAEAVRIADEYLATHRLALLLLTASQTAGAKYVRERSQHPEDKPNSPHGSP